MRHAVGVDDAPRSTRYTIGASQSPHALSIRASPLINAGMPNASQAQLAYQDRLPLVTRCGVGTAENGSAIHTSLVRCIEHDGARLVQPLVGQP